MQNFMPGTQPRGTHSFDPSSGSSAQSQALQMLDSINSEDDGAEDRDGPPFNIPLTNIAGASSFPSPLDASGLTSNRDILGFGAFGTTPSIASESSPASQFFQLAQDFSSSGGTRPPSSSSLPAAAHPSPFFSNQRRDSGISVGSVLSSNTDSDPGKTQLRKRKHTDNGRSAPPSTKCLTTSRSKSKTDDLNPVIITNALNSTLNRLADVMQKTLDASQATATKSTIASAATPSMTNAIPPIVTPPIESQTTQPSSDPSSVSSQGILNQEIEVATSDDTLLEDELFAASLFFTSATEEAVRAASTFIALGNNQVVQRRFLRRQLDVAALLPGKGKGKAVNSDDGDDPMVY